MAAQEQKKEIGDWTFEEDRTQRPLQGIKRPSGKKDRSSVSWKQIVLAIVTCTVAVLGVRLWNRSALFAVSEGHAPEGYLPLSSYRLFTQSEEELNPIRFSGEDMIYTFNGYPAEDLYHTEKHISPGSSWNEFVTVYGSYHGSFLTADYYGPGEDFEITESVFESEMTIEEFDRTYIGNHLSAPLPDNLHISFNAYIKGNQIAYTQADQDELYQLYSDSVWPEGSVLNPKMQSVSMGFDFVISDEELIVDSIYVFYELY